MSVAVVAVYVCGACEPVRQHGAEGRHENRGLLPVSTRVRLLIFFALPAPDTFLDPSMGKEGNSWTWSTLAVQG